MIASLFDIATHSGGAAQANITGKYVCGHEISSPTSWSVKQNGDRTEIVAGASSTDF